MMTVAKIDRGVRIIWHLHFCLPACLCLLYMCDGITLNYSRKTKGLESERMERTCLIRNEILLLL